MIARGKSRLVGTSPLDKTIKLARALKVRNTVIISHFQCSLQNLFEYQGRRTLLRGAWPWLSYFAPLALSSPDLRLLRRSQPSLNFWRRGLGEIFENCLYSLSVGFVRCSITAERASLTSDRVARHQQRGHLKTGEFFSP